MINNNLPTDVVRNVLVVENDQPIKILDSPYNLYYYNVRQQGVKTLDNTMRNIFNPFLSATDMINSNNDLSSSISKGRSFGGLDKFYNSYIIGRYRSMQRYDARLLRNDNRSARISYKYKNPLKANFDDFSAISGPVLTISYGHY
ncbi:MAG: hypothetical protein ACTHYC_13335 [Sphingobacterium sp.]